MSGYRQTVAEIRVSQNFKEFYSANISARASAFISAACVGTNITPNHITLSMIPVGLMASLIIGTQGLKGMLVGSVLFVVLNILDAADGELARYTNQTSIFGSYLDKVAHYVTDIAFTVAWGFAVYILAPSDYTIILLILAAVVVTGDACMRDLLPDEVVRANAKINDTGDIESARKNSSRLSESFGFAWFKNTASNVASWHILPVITCAALIIQSNLPVVLYFNYVVYVNALKFCARARLVYEMR